MLKIKDMNLNNVIRQGDSQPRQYQLDTGNLDLNLTNKSATIRLMTADFQGIGYETTATVSSENKISFSIDDVIPARQYRLEVTVDDYVFPSRATDGQFNIDPSSHGQEVNIIQIIGKDEIVREVKSRVENELEPFLGEIEQAELDRQAQEEARETAETQREANEGDRVQAEIEREIIFEAQKKPLIMGVEWGRTASPTMTRIGASRDLVANIGIADEVVRNDFDTMPIYREMQRETDKYGNVFVRIPKFYIRKTVTEDLYRVEISTEKLKGFYLPAIFYDFEKDKELEYSLFGAYLASDSVDGTKLESKPGVKPLVSRNIVQFRDYAMANGLGYQQLDIHAIDILQALFRVEFATLNSQSLHPGFTSDNAESDFTGGVDELTATSGAMGTSSSHQFVYRGIEDPWGNVYQFVDGLNINDHQAWVCRDARQYASNVFASPYEKLGYVNATGNTWVTKMGYDPFLPFSEFSISGGGGPTTYYADHYYQSAGQRIARFGGDWSNGTFAGLSFWDLRNSSANATHNIGGRLIKKTL